MAAFCGYEPIQIRRFDCWRLAEVTLSALEAHTAADPTLCVDMRMPDLLTPLIIVGNGRGALIGAVNPTVYSRLVSRDATNPYKILVRNITEEDLRNA